MAFLDSPILKSRRMGALSPETARKFNKKDYDTEEVTDFKKIHQNIACTATSYTLLDHNANASAMKRITEDSKKQAEQLEHLRDSFNKVITHEKNGFSYDEDITSEVSRKLQGLRAGSLDPTGGVSDVYLTSCRQLHVSSADEEEESTTYMPESTLYDTVVSDGDTESVSSFSDFEMDIVSQHESDMPQLEPLDVETPESDTQLSSMSLVLSPNGIYSIGGDQGFAIVNHIRSSPTDDKHLHQSEPDLCHVEEIVSPPEAPYPECETCAKWERYPDERSETAGEDVNEDDVPPPPDINLKMVVGSVEKAPITIAILQSPILPRRVLLLPADSPRCHTNSGSSGFESGNENKVADLDDAGKAFALELDEISLALKLDLLQDDDDYESRSISESLETRSLASYDFEELEFALNNDEMEEFKAFRAELDEQPKKSLINKLRNQRIKDMVGQAKSICHSASADFAKTRGGLKRSDSQVGKLRASSSSSMFAKNLRNVIKRPNYDLTSTLDLHKHDIADIANLDSRLRLRNKKVVEVEPLTRWKKRPSYTETTSGHKAWYQKIQDRIEKRRKEMANVDSLGDQDVDILVRAIVSRCTCKTPFQLDRVGDGKYKLPNTSQIFFVRILRNHVMVRVGGGWDTLDHFIAKHDPCRMKLKQISGTPNTRSVKSKVSSTWSADPFSRNRSMSLFTGSSSSASPPEQPWIQEDLSPAAKIPRQQNNNFSRTNSARYVRRLSYSSDSEDLNYVAPVCGGSEGSTSSIPDSEFDLIEDKLIASATFSPLISFRKKGKKHVCADEQLTSFNQTPKKTSSVLRTKSMDRKNNAVSTTPRSMIPVPTNKSRSKSCERNTTNTVSNVRTPQILKHSKSTDLNHRNDIVMVPRRKISTPTTPSFLTRKEKEKELKSAFVKTPQSLLKNPTSATARKVLRSKSSENVSQHLVNLANNNTHNPPPPRSRAKSGDYSQSKIVMTPNKPNGILKKSRSTDLSKQNIVSLKRDEIIMKPDLTALNTPKTANRSFRDWLKKRRNEI